MPDGNGGVVVRGADLVGGGVWDVWCQRAGVWRGELDLNVVGREGSPCKQSGGGVEGAERSRMRRGAEMVGAMVPRRGGLGVRHSICKG